jgi:hypothetical protein
LTRWLPPIVLSAFLAAAAAPEARADLAKLDPRARVALARLRAGAPGDDLGGGRFAATPAGDLEVFILGAAGRAQLEGAGARVRTVLPGVCTATVPVAALESLAALTRGTPHPRAGPRGLAQ